MHKYKDKYLSAINVYQEAILLTNTLLSFVRMINSLKTMTLPSKFVPRILYVIWKYGWRSVHSKKMIPFDAYYICQVFLPFCFTLYEKCPNTEFFEYVFSRISTDYRDLLSQFPYSNQKSSVFGHSILPIIWLTNLGWYMNAFLTRFQHQ